MLVAYFRRLFPARLVSSERNNQPILVAYFAALLILLALPVLLVLLVLLVVLILIVLALLPVLPVLLVPTHPVLEALYGTLNVNVV